VKWRYLTLRGQEITVIGTVEQDSMPAKVWRGIDVSMGGSSDAIRVKLAKPYVRYGKAGQKFCTTHMTLAKDRIISVQD
jgi:hypothetical protein